MSDIYEIAALRNRFINRDDINFENVEQLKPIQEWTLAEEDPGGDIEYPTQCVPTPSSPVSSFLESIVHFRHHLLRISTLRHRVLTAGVATHRLTKFGNCRSVTMFISQNYGADRTKIHYIGLKGEFTPMKREPVRATYELVPTASKNANPAEQAGSHTIS